MSMGNKGMRAGAVAVALGLSLAGPHAMAIAHADTGTSGSTSAPSSGGKGPESRSTARSQRPGGSTSRKAAHPAPARSRPRLSAQRRFNYRDCEPNLRSPGGRPSQHRVTTSRADDTRGAYNRDPCTRRGATATLVAAPAAAALTGSPVKRILDAVATWLSTLPANPITDALEGGLLLIRRTLFPSVDQPPDETPVVTTPTITIHNTSATDTMWITTSRPRATTAFPARSSRSR